MTKSEIAIAFSNGDFHKCFNFITDETIWNTPGEHYLLGKETIIAFCNKTSAYFNSLTTNFKQLNVIENDRCVAVNGTAEFIKDGQMVSFVSSCDVYEFTSENKIISITSYCITENLK